MSQRSAGLRVAMPRVLPREADAACSSTRSVEHTSERLKAKAPQPAPTQGTRLAEHGAQVRQRATHRRRRLFVRVRGGATRSGSASRRQRCDRHEPLEPRRRADLPKSEAPWRQGERSEGGCDAERWTQGCAERRTGSSTRTRRGGDGRTQRCARFGRLSEGTARPSPQGEATNGPTDVQRRVRSPQGFWTGRTQVARERWEDQTRAKRTHERAGRVAALRAADGGQPLNAGVAHNPTCASRGMALRVSFCGAPHRRAAAEHLSGWQRSDRASRNLRGFSTLESTRQRGPESGDEADDDSVTPVRQCWSIGSRTGSAGGSEPPPECLESPGEETVGKRSVAQATTTVWLRDAGEQPSARTRGATRRFESGGGDDLTDRTACIGSEDAPSGGPRCDAAKTASEPASGAARAQRKQRSTRSSWTPRRALPCGDVQQCTCRPPTRRTCPRERRRRANRSRAQHGATEDGAGRSPFGSGSGAAARADSVWERTKRRRSQAATARKGRAGSHHPGREVPEREAQESIGHRTPATESGATDARREQSHEDRTSPGETRTQLANGRMAADRW